MTEQQLIIEFYPTNYHDKTISDLVEDLKTIQSNFTYRFFAENGDAWKTSVKVDRAIRKAKHPRTGAKEVFYLHPSKKPLEDIDFGDGQLEMFEGFDCEGYCGL